MQHKGGYLIINGFPGIGSGLLDHRPQFLQELLHRSRKTHNVLIDGIYLHVTLFLTKIKNANRYNGAVFYQNKGWIATVAPWPLARRRSRSATYGVHKLFERQGLGVVKTAVVGAQQGDVQALVVGNVPL